MTLKELVKLTMLWTTGPWSFMLYHSNHMSDLEIKVMDLEKNYVKFFRSKTQFRWATLSCHTYLIKGSKSLQNSFRGSLPTGLTLLVFIFLSETNIDLYPEVLSRLLEAVWSLACEPFKSLWLIELWFNFTFFFMKVSLTCFFHRYVPHMPLYQNC